MAEYIDDPELIAMTKVKKAVDLLTPVQRDRVFAWIKVRAEEDQTAQTLTSQHDIPPTPMRRGDVL